MEFARRHKLLTFLIIVSLIFGSFWLYLKLNYTTPILMYHSFDGAKVGSYAAVEPQVFYDQMMFIKKKGYNVISLSQYCRLLKDGSPIPKKSVVITIDDGWKDTLAAIGILKAFDFPATMFIIAKRVSKQEYLSKKDIIYFLENTKIEIASHTLTHSYLPDLSQKQIKREVSGSKRALEKKFSQGVESLAYPFGGFNEQSLVEVKNAGYLCACSTNRGFSKLLNLFALRRMKISNRDVGFRLWAKLSGYYIIFKKPKNPY